MHNCHQVKTESLSKPLVKETQQSTMLYYGKNKRNYLISIFFHFEGLKQQCTHERFKWYLSCNFKIGAGNNTYKNK